MLHQWYEGEKVLNLAARSLCLTSRKPPDIRTTAVALGGVVESMVSWKMLQDLHVHIHIWPLCNAGCCTMGPKIISEVVSFSYIFRITILSTIPPRATAVVLISGVFLLVKHRLWAAKLSTFSPLYRRYKRYFQTWLTQKVHKIVQFYLMIVVEIMKMWKECCKKCKFKTFLTPLHHGMLR